MAKKKKSRRTSRRFPILFAAIVTLLVIIAALGYYLYTLGYSKGYEKAKISHHIDIAKIRKQERAKLEKIYEHKSEPSEIIDLSTSQKIVTKQHAQQYAEQNRTKPKPKKSYRHTTIALHSKKPVLAIIIDDVAFGYQVRAIKRLGLPINVSFFPPNWRHPNTPRYAKTLRHYMIHLPMEAMHYAHPEANTLLTTSSDAFMERTIAKIRREFPRARYVNNHTGSKFTSNYDAMLRLIPILAKYHFRFVDSRTTPDSKVKEALAFYGLPYIHRDIFLDNKQNVAAIKKQLAKAIRIARRKGFAIAIGHPHPATLKALAESKGVLKQVHLIYLDELRFRSR